MGSQAGWVSLCRPAPRRTGWQFGGDAFDQSGTTTSQTAAGIDQFHPRRQTVTLAPRWFAVGESGQSSDMPPIGAGKIRRIELRQPLGDARGERGWKRIAGHANPGLHPSGTALDHDTRLMALCPQRGQDAWKWAVEIEQDVAGIQISDVRTEIHVIAFAIANAQEAQGGGIQELGCSPPPHAGIWSVGATMNQAHFV